MNKKNNAMLEPASTSEAGPESTLPEIKSANQGSSSQPDTHKASAKKTTAKSAVYARDGKIVFGPDVTAVPLSMVPLLLADVAAGANDSLATAQYMQAVYDSVLLGKLPVRERQGAIVEVQHLPTQYDQLSRRDLQVDVKDFSLYVQDNYPQIVISGLNKPVKAEWDEYRLRKLLEDFNEPGATQDSLSEKYGISRQAIQKHLKKAKSLGVNKASHFSALFNQKRK